MNRIGMICFVLLVSVLTGIAGAEIRQIEEYGTHEMFETHKVMIRCDPEDLTPPNDQIRYRYPSPRGRGVRVCVDNQRSVFQNCRVAYDCCLVPGSGEWSTGCIVIEPIDIESPWEYQLEIEMIY